MIDTEEAPEVPSPARAYQGVGPWRQEVRRFVELFALSGVAVVQPTLDILSNNPSLFVTRGTTAAQAILLVLLLALVPPVVLWLGTVVVGALVPPARRYAHALAAALVIGVIVIEVMKERTSAATAVLWILGVSLGIAGGVALLRSELVRSFLRYLAIAVPVFALLFLAASPVTKVVFSSDPASASGVGIDTPHRVVFVVFDELPLASLLDGEGGIDAELFPSLAGLAADGTFYRNTTTVASYTQRAVPAMLSGQFPTGEGQLPFSSDHPENLFTLLGEGYTVNSHESITRLCPEEVCGARTAGFTGLLEDAFDLWKEFSKPERVEEQRSLNAALAFPEEPLPPARRFVRSLRARANDTFDFAHMELPHNPWRFLPTMQDTQATQSEIRGASLLQWTSEPAALLARQRHLLQVQAADVVLGNVLEKLRSIGEYDDAMIVVTADHGVSFTDGQPLRHVAPGNYDEIMWVPLLVKYPNGQKAGEVDDRPALTVDIAPTVAEVVGADVPWEMDGRSLLGDPRPEGSRPIYQWDSDGFPPPDPIELAPGEDHFEFDGAAGFSRTLARRAAAPGPDRDLRIYRSDLLFGDLVGVESAPFVVADGNPGDSATLNQRDHFANLDPDAATVPWAYIEALGNGFREEGPVALALNGRVVAVSYLELVNDEGGAFFTLNLPPHLAVPGRNVPELYLVHGTPAAPQLEPVTLNM
jgi:hypothetical protein